MITTLQIGAIEVPAQSLLDFRQEYEPLAGQTFRRTADGSGVLRTTWSGKLRTRLNGRGWVPSAFENLAVGSSYVMRCAMPRQAASATASVTLPSTRRSDAGHVPIGFALVDDELVQTVITGIVADVATLTTVAGADGYRVHYFPEITVVITENTCEADASAQFAWRIEAEEL